jgi:hypothetical protein
LCLLYIRRDLLQHVNRLFHRSGESSRQIRRGLLHRSGLLHRTCRGLLQQSSELRATSELCTGELHTSTSLHSPKQQGHIALKVHVANVCFKYFRCFRGMFQVFLMDIAKVDWDVAHVAMAIYVCRKSLFKMFYLFQTYVASILSGCCIHKHVASVCFKYFIRMSHMFHLYVGYARVFKQVF